MSRLEKVTAIGIKNPGCWLDTELVAKEIGMRRGDLNFMLASLSTTQLLKRHGLQGILMTESGEAEVRYVGAECLKFKPEEDIKPPRHKDDQVLHYLRVCPGMTIKEIADLELFTYDEAVSGIAYSLEHGQITNGPNSMGEEGAVDLLIRHFPVDGKYNITQEKPLLSDVYPAMREVSPYHRPRKVVKHPRDLFSEPAPTHEPAEPTAKPKMTIAAATIIRENLQEKVDEYKAEITRLTVFINAARNLQVSKSDVQRQQKTVDESLEKLNLTVFETDELNTEDGSRAHVTTARKANIPGSPS